MSSVNSALGTVCCAKFILPHSKSQIPLIVLCSEVELDYPPYENSSVLPEYFNIVMGV